MHKLSISAIETGFDLKSCSPETAQNPNKFLNLVQHITVYAIMWVELFCYTKYKFSSLFIYPYCGHFLCMMTVSFMSNCISFHANSVKIIEIIVRNWYLVIFSSVCSKINRFLLNNRTNSQAKGNSYLTK